MSGRTDVESTSNDFIFTPASNSSFDSFNIIDDSVLEFDELLIATFDIGPEITNNWNVVKGTPSITKIAILDNDCEQKHLSTTCIHFSHIVLLSFISCGGVL